MEPISELIIRDYLLDKGRPSHHMKSDRFDALSYECWATYEILKMVIKNPDIPATSIISEFTNKMYCYKYLKSDCKDIFEAGIRVGEDLLDIFEAMQ